MYKGLEDTGLNLVEEVFHVVPEKVNQQPQEGF
jgi:hypothetical protein